MSTSQATIDPTQIPLTPMRVTFSGNDLGGTVGGVDLSVKYETSPIMVDQFGKTEINRKVSGQAYTIKMTLAQIIDKDKVKVVLPSSHEIVSGINKSIYQDMQIGDDLLSHAQQLILHPLEKSNADLSEDWLFYKAVCIGTTEVKYGAEKQSGMTAEFVVFPDTGISPARFLVYGDPTIGIVNAAAGAAVAGGGNVGNGPVGTIAVYNGFTKTETITMTCLGVPATNKSNWEVHGSLSGPLGILQLANSSSGMSASFTTPGSEISFTMTSSSVPYAVNDTFTISTTGANFA